MSTPCWRPMQVDDLPAVTAISARVHGRYAESLEIYAERLTLFPAGCFTCVAAETVVGFLVFHPWQAGSPPTLGEPLGALPAHPDVVYLHDIALLPEARGSGAGAQALGLVDAEARRCGLHDIALVAVNGAESYWQMRGFRAAPLPPSGQESYGLDAHYMARTLS